VNDTTLENGQNSVNFKFTENIYSDIPTKANVPNLDGWDLLTVDVEQNRIARLFCINCRELDLLPGKLLLRCNLNSLDMKR